MAATPSELAQLRLWINEPDTETYSDEALQLLIEANGGDLRKTASAIWKGKASSYAELVDVTEGASSRKLSQLHTQALSMAKQFDDTPVVEPTRARRPARTRPIERP